ncbi:hypothetical protein BDZ97DRAFT_1758470 [Flammula alnicola]|nr:hypothetical protein BDZ97DRAFT_1758470 [Flammula alnicola]
MTVADGRNAFKLRSLGLPAGPAYQVEASHACVFRSTCGGTVVARDAVTESCVVEERIKSGGKTGPVWVVLFRMGAKYTEGDSHEGKRQGSRPGQDTAASSTPVAAEEPPFSITDTQLQSPRSPRVARPPRSSVTPLTTTTTTTSIVSAPSSPPLPARSPLRPAARSISTQSTTSGTFDFSGSIPAGTTTDTNPKTNPGTLLVSSSNVSTLTLDSPVSPLTPTDDFGAAPVGTGIPAIIHMRDRHNSIPSLNGLIDQVREEFGITENEEDATQPLRLKSAGATSATSAETNADDGNNKVLLKKSLHLDNRPDSPPLSIDLSLEEEQ